MLLFMICLLLFSGIGTAVFLFIRSLLYTHTTQLFQY